MIPQKVITSQQRRIYDLLCSPNPDGFTRMQIARCLGIERATVCRRVAELRELGVLKVVKKGRCPITHEQATFLSCYKGLIESVPSEEPKTEETGSLFD
jgi:DNA-binding transcriptional regulator LsrR (DeoR family)